MSKTFSRVLSVSAILYLLLPNVLFLMGWVEPWVGIPLIILLSLAFILLLKKSPAPRISFEKKDILFALLLLLGCLFAVESLGINGHAQQSGDFIVRNAIYDSLVRESWPLHSERGEYFVYYHAYWLPPALLAKWLGASFSTVLLWGWTVLGFVLGFSLLYLRFKRCTLLLMAILFLTGPLNTWGELPYILRELSEKVNSLTPLAQVSYEYLGELNQGFAYVSFWNQIAFNSFNNALPFFVFMAWFFACRPQPVQALSAASLTVVTSPLTALVTLPYLAICKWKQRSELLTKRAFLLVPFVLLLAVVALYYSGGNSSTVAFLWNNLPEVSGKLADASARFSRHLLIMHLMIIPTFFLLRKRFKRTAAYRYAILLIALLPLIWIGRWNNELLIKGSILLFFLLAIMYALLICYEKGVRRYAAIVFLALTSIMFFWDMAARFLHFYSWNPQQMEKNIRTAWNGHLNHPDHPWYKNFWGTRNSSILKP